MDEFEISIERSSGESSRPKSEMPQVNPRIAAAAAAVFVLALVMWLGAQTPARTTPTTIAPVTTTTAATLETTTTEVQFAAPGPVLVTPSIEAEPFVSPVDEWLTELEANPPVALGLSGRPLFLFALNFDGGGTLIELGPGEVNSTRLSCEGVPLQRIVGELPGKLLFKTTADICMVSLDQPTESIVVPGAQDYETFIAAGENSGWFCRWRPGTTAVIARFEVGGGVSKSIEAPGCPIRAEGDNLLIFDEEEVRPGRWLAGQLMELISESNFEECVAAGFSEDYEVCQSGDSIDLTGFFSGVTLTTPVLPELDGFWLIQVSPDSRRALLLALSDSGIVEEPVLFVVDFELKEIIQLDSSIRTFFGSWFSNSELLLQDFFGGRVPCDDCVEGLILVNIESGDIEQLTPSSLNLEAGYIQVLGTRRWMRLRSR